MSTGDRAYNILRGWVNHEWDRIREIERDVASDELNTALQQPAPARPRPAEQTEEEAEAAREDARSHARNLLGVGERATFETIRKAFDRLNKRSDPARYPANSPEAKQAGEIQKRIHWAYQMLTYGVDTVEKRFRSLELE